MHFSFFVIVLSLHEGYSLRSFDSLSKKHGSHNLLQLERSNNSVQRQVRCTPCESGVKRPVSNHLDPEYRGNGADNLGYDWSPMAWGGLAFPRRSKYYMGGMRGRDGRMMINDGGRNQGGAQVICDTCRSYWDYGREGGRGRGRQFDMSGGRDFYGGQPGYWRGDNMQIPGDYEAKVMSPTVGVLVKPGSRIAYIPSRSGEMYWDGVSGGGTRWDGFSNGISWIGNAPAEWDRSDSEPRDGPLRPGGDFSSGPNSFNRGRPPPNWGENSPGRGYYFTNGVPNDIDPQWRDRGYASNWHYGSTNQNGWNGNNMKWNFGGKQWPDNDRAPSRFYFNSPQDRAYGPNDGRPLYGNQYPNYQPGAGYPSSFRPQPSWPTGGPYRPNDRFPGGFQQGSYANGDKDKPWDYTSRDPSGYRQPGSQPVWARPGPSYPASGNFVGNYGKGPNESYDKYSPSDKNDFEKPWNRPSSYGPFKPSSGGGFPHGGNRYPEESGGSSGQPNFPAGSGHLFFPNDENRQSAHGNGGYGSGENRPGYPGGTRKPGEYPGYGNQTPGRRPSEEYPGDKRPSYTGGRPLGVGGSTGSYPGGSSSGSYPGGGSSGRYPEGSSGSYPGGSFGSYPGGGSSSGSYPGGGSSSGSYPGGGSSSGSYPGGGSSTGSYPGGGSSSGSYPGGGSSSGSYPGGGSSSGSYPGGGNSGSYPGGSYSVTEGSGGYPGGGGSYPSGSRPGEYPYPSEGSRPGGYPIRGSYPVGGNRPGQYYGGSSGGYPVGSDSLYPRPSAYPSGGGPVYTGGISRPGFTPDGYPSPGYYGGNRPFGYPGTGRPGGYGGDYSRPDDYYTGGRPSYPMKGPVPYPGGGSGGIYQGSRNPQKGFYMGFITELSGDDRPSQYGGKNPNYFGSSYPGDKNYYPGKDRDIYYNEGSYPNGYPSGDKNRYPAFSEDRYSGGGGGGGGGAGGYPTGDNSGRDKYYYGQSGGKGKYPGGYPSNHRYPNGGGDDYDRNQGSSSDKNSWNYGQNDHKEGIYRRSGGSYPPYRGGQYYTSSYLASMSTTAGSTQAGAEQKTQSATTADEVTQPTSDSS